MNNWPNEFSKRVTYSEDFLITAVPFAQSFLQLIVLVLQPSNLTILINFNFILVAAGSRIAQCGPNKYFLMNHTDTTNQPSLTLFCINQ